MNKMKRIVKMRRKFLSRLMLATLIFGIPRFTSFAAEMSVAVEDENVEIEVLEAKLITDVSFEISPYTMLADCIIGVSCASDGMHIDISTGVVGTASVLGVKDVKIKKKTWYGGWTTVAVSDGGESYNMGTMGINILYSNAVKDATYKITCIHYGNVNGYIEGENDSGEFVFTY